MKRTRFVIMTGILFASTAAAQSQAGAQTGAQTGAQAGAQAGGQTSVQAGKTQAQGSGSASAGAAASAQKGQTNASLANGSTINAALTAPVDSKKCKPGDTVTAHTTEATKSEGKMVIPKGAKLVGHVTQASARAKGDADSSLGIVFDKAILKNGEEVPLNVAVQALASAQSAAATNVGGEMPASAMGGGSASAAGSGRAMGGGALGGVTSAAGGAAGTVTNTAASAGSTAGGTLNSTARSTTNAAAGEKGAVGGLNAAGQLTSGSQGVFGMQGVGLSSATTGAAQEALITSAGKNVHLDSGTQMLLVTQAAATSETPKP
jgi:hypothetical protein